MILKRTNRFKKQYQKLPKRFQAQFDTRLRLFIKNPADVRLQNHPLKGQLAGYWSMNVNGDLRALYIKDGEEIIIFALIGTHSQLYGK